MRTSCPQGHAYDESNAYINKAGYKVCRRCRNDGTMRSRRARQAREKHLARLLRGGRS